MRPPCQCILRLTCVKFLRNIRTISQIFAADDRHNFRCTLSVNGLCASIMSSLWALLQNGRWSRITETWYWRLARWSANCLPIEITLLTEAGTRKVEPLDDWTLEAWGSLEVCHATWLDQVEFGWLWIVFAVQSISVVAHICIINSRSSKDPVFCRELTAGPLLPRS